MKGKKKREKKSRGGREEAWVCAAGGATALVDLAGWRRCQAISDGGRHGGERKDRRGRKREEEKKIERWRRERRESSSRREGCWPKGPSL